MFTHRFLVRVLGQVLVQFSKHSVLKSKILKQLGMTFTILLCALVLSTCSSSEKKKKQKAPDWTEGTQNVKGQEARDYRRAKNLFNKGLYARALESLKSFEKDYPNSEQMPYAHNMRGLIYFMTQKPKAAVYYFRKALKLASDPSFEQYLYYNLASAQFSSNEYGNSEKTLKKIDPEDLDHDTRLKYHYLNSQIIRKLGTPLEAVNELLTAAPILEMYYDDEKSEQDENYVMFTRQLDSLLEYIDDLPTLEGLYTDYSDSVLAEPLLFRLAVLTSLKGETAAAEGYYRKIVQDYPDSPHFDQAIEGLRVILDQAAVNTKTIGVLLPMKGRYSAYGQKTLQGVELAFRLFNTKLPDSRVTLVVEDSGETPEEAVAALNRLFFDHHVVAVVGPLRSKNVTEVSMRAQELGLPLVSLAQKNPEKGDFVFQTAVTHELQAKEIARYAIQEEGMKRFAILRPDDHFGQDYANHFWDAVEELGGEVVGIEKYPPKEADFRKYIDKLTGRFYKEARQKELDELEYLRKTNNIRRRTRRTEHFFALKPIVDFDAVFIPDSAKQVGQILPTFAYRDVENVRFLGISTWNSPLLVRRAKSHAEGATFVDTFFKESDSPTTTSFLKRYRGTFKTEPTAFEALSYDAALLLDHVLLLSDASISRMEIRDKLMEVNNFPGVTGKITYNTGVFKRKLRVFKVQEGEISLQ